MFVCTIEVGIDLWGAGEIPQPQVQLLSRPNIDHIITKTKYQNSTRLCNSKKHLDFNLFRQFLNLSREGDPLVEMKHPLLKSDKESCMVHSPQCYHLQSQTKTNVNIKMLIKWQQVNEILPLQTAMLK